MSQIAVAQALQIGREHHAAGRLAEAGRIYRQVLARQPNQPAALHLLALLAHDTGHLDDAAELLKRSIAQRPSDEGHLTLAFVFHELGRLEEALASYQAGLQLNPKVAAAQSNLADLLNQFGRPQEAEAACRAAIAQQPEFPAPYNNLGNALRMMGRQAEALDAYRATIRLVPDYADAHVNLGHTLLDLGRASEAADAFRAAANAAAVSNGDPTRALGILGITLGACAGPRKPKRFSATSSRAADTRPALQQPRHRAGRAAGAMRKPPKSFAARSS